MRAIFFVLLALFVAISGGVRLIGAGFRDQSVLGTVLKIGGGLLLVALGVGYIGLVGFRILKNQALPSTPGKHARRIW